MFNEKSGGYNLSDIAAITGNRDSDNAFGNNGWWIILLFLFTGWGWGGTGFNNRENSSLPCATQADVRAAVDQQTLISKLDQQTYGLADSTYALNNTITNGFHGVDNAICTLGYNMQAGVNDLSHQISNNSSTIQNTLESNFAQTNYNLATQLCDTRRTVSDSARDIIDNNNEGIRSILNFLTQDKIASLQAENQNLRFAASQEAQNNYLVQALRPAPIPAYTVANPYCCNTYYSNCGV